MGSPYLFLLRYDCFSLGVVDAWYGIFLFIKRECVCIIEINEQLFDCSLQEYHLTSSFM